MTPGTWNMTPDTYFLHLTSNDAWLAAVGPAGLPCTERRTVWRGKEGAYYADSLYREGFIHCSKPSQIVDVANSFYRGRQGLVLLVIDPSKLESELKWEPPAELEPNHARAGDLFPHIYGPLNLDAVVKVIPFKPNADGSFSLPQALAA
jgi:uncharacterized protein (DUF952 family)